VALKIFSYLDVKSLCRAAQVCSSWKKLADADSLWQLIVKSRWAHSEREQIKNWKNSYQAKLVLLPLLLLPLLPFLLLLL
jgi:hypothetical protein